MKKHFHEHWEIEIQVFTDGIFQKFLFNMSEMRRRRIKSNQ